MTTRSGELQRLPSGYKAKVNEVAKEIREFIKLLNKETLSAQIVAEELNRFAFVSNIYAKNDNILSYDFDYKLLGAHISFNEVTKKLSLDNDCTVFIDDTQQYIDNYKLRK